MEKTKKGRRKTTVTLKLPPEFLTLCANHGADPELVLRGFIADLAGIMNWSNAPRADGYSSNGSDERRMAWDYYARVGYPYWKEWGFTSKE